MVLTKCIFRSSFCKKPKKKKRKWQQETGILRGRRPRRSLSHQTISIGFVSEPNSCFELGRLKQLVSFQIFLHKKRERNRDVRMTHYYSHKTVRINPSASRSSSTRRKTLSPFLLFTCFFDLFTACAGKKCTVNMSQIRWPLLRSSSQNRACDRTSSISDTSRCENGKRVEGQRVQKQAQAPICTQQVWHLGVKTSHHAKAHPLCQSPSPRLQGKSRGESISIRESWE